MNIEEYKIFKFDGENIDTNIFKSVISKHPSKDIYYEIKDNKAFVYVRQLDFINFKKDIESLKSKKSNNNVHTINCLTNLLNDIESIKSYGLKGKKRLYIGYDKERKVKNRKRKEQKREIYFYANNNNFSNINNDLPEKFTNKIICGDSEIVLKTLPDNCIDLILTSPPYNFGLDYYSSNDANKWELYFDKLFKVFDECIRVLKFGGRIIINVQPLFSDYIPSHHIISNFFMNRKLIWKGEILWEKNNYNCKYTAWGSWKSPSNPYLKYTWEFLEIFCKGTLKKEGEKENIDIKSEEFKKWVVGKWQISPEKKMKYFEHPAMFPESLARQSLKLFSYKKDIILDPFNGVGTTTFVSHNLDRRYIGIDISDKYCKSAIKRIKTTLF